MKEVQNSIFLYNNSCIFNTIYLHSQIIKFKELKLCTNKALNKILKKIYLDQQNKIPKILITKVHYYFLVMKQDKFLHRLAFPVVLKSQSPNKHLFTLTCTHKLPSCICRKRKEFNQYSICEKIFYTVNQIYIACVTLKVIK